MTEQEAQQAQKIKELKEDVRRLEMINTSLYTDSIKQAKEIKRLKNALDSLTFRPPVPQGYTPA